MISETDKQHLARPAPSRSAIPTGLSQRIGVPTGGDYATTEGPSSASAMILSRAPRSRRLTIVSNIGG